MSEPWLLVVDPAADQPDVPRLVILQHKPREITVGQTLKLTFDGACGAVWTGGRSD